MEAKMEQGTSTPTDVTVYKTTDYALFSLIPANRPIYQIHLNKLVLAIKTRNKLAQNPIRVSSDGEILDGQHRLAAAQILNVPIYYYIDHSDTDVTDIALENYTVRKWTLEDIMNYWCEQGAEEYIAMRDFRAHRPWISMSVAIAVLQGRKSNSYIKGKNREEFVLGQFKITDMTYAMKFANAISDFMEVIDFATHKPFMAAISYLLRHPEYDHERLIQKMERGGITFTKQVSQMDYLREIEGAYNHYSKKATRIRFF
jgi:hypothetical protein